MTEREQAVVAAALREHELIEAGKQLGIENARLRAALKDAVIALEVAATHAQHCTEYPKAMKIEFPRGDVFESRSMWEYLKGSMDAAHSALNAAHEREQGGK